VARTQENVSRCDERDPAQPYVVRVDRSVLSALAGIGPALLFAAVLIVVLSIFNPAALPRRVGPGEAHVLAALCAASGVVACMQEIRGAQVSRTSL
jgi:hypothetical protein